MQLSGSRMIGAERAAVWSALNDPAVLGACIPGCESIQKTSETSFEAVVKQKVGPVSATFRGAVELSEINAPESYRISGEGKGGAAGFAKGGANVSLREAAGGTELSYEVDAKVGGKIAQLGARLIDGFAKKLAEEFFTSFQQVVEGDGAAEKAGADASPEADTGDGSGDKPAKKGWLKRLTG